MSVEADAERVGPRDLRIRDVGKCSGDGDGSSACESTSEYGIRIGNGERLIRVYLPCPEGEIIGIRLVIPEDDREDSSLGSCHAGCAGGPDRSARGGSRERYPIRLGTVPEGKRRMVELFLYLGWINGASGGWRCWRVGYVVECDRLSSVWDDHVGSRVVEDESSSGGSIEPIRTGKGLLRENVPIGVRGDLRDLQSPGGERDAGGSGNALRDPEHGSTDCRDSGVGMDGEITLGVGFGSEVRSLGPDFSGFEPEGYLGREIVVVAIRESAQCEYRLAAGASEREFGTVGDMQECGGSRRDGHAISGVEFPGEREGDSFVVRDGYRSGRTRNAGGYLAFVGVVREILGTVL